jgi:aminopeptidase C
MSIFDSTFPNRNYNTLEKSFLPGLLSLNEVLQESLKKAQAQVDKAQLIVRCENLPLVQADHGEMVRLFDDLIAMILNQPPNTTRLFLYVDCEENNSDMIDMTLQPGFKKYTIKFHTNITTHEHWKIINNNALINCKQILSRHNGNLAVHDISSTGCLFSLSLPGKIE